ncbi:hypothetical protein C8R43DRAFT_72255 [Mycena crocata]|nr:hypothetical protein C8R43DRAFT_72255 [Mycena crocata]
MKSATLLTAVLAVAAGASAQQLTINTPTPGAAQCQPFLISWTGGTPPYFVVSFSLI